MKQYIATINGLTVRATATGLYCPGDGYRKTMPKIEFYPEGRRGHSLLLEDVYAADAEIAAQVAGDILLNMGFEQTA